AARLCTVASSQPLPPTRLLVLWPTVTAESCMPANCCAPRNMSPSSTTPDLSERHGSHGDLAVTRAACTETCGGTIAHHSASGTASMPTMNTPIRARQPQLSFCVTLKGSSIEMPPRHNHLTLRSIAQRCVSKGGNEHLACS